MKGIQIKNDGEIRRIWKIGINELIEEENERKWT